MKYFILFFILVVVLASYPFFNNSENAEKVTGLPWQIEIGAHGSTKVFGIRPGHSRLADAREVMGDDMELAIIAASDEAGALEMYYGHYRAGLLSGKLVLRTDSSAQLIQAWRANAVSSVYMPTGLAKKYIPSAEDLPQILEQTVTALTFIPATNLDEAIILARFGEPVMRIQKAGVEHFLYPEKGLDIALHLDSKEVLQYVSPDAFQRLMEPLK